MQRAAETCRSGADDQDVRFQLFALYGHSGILSNNCLMKSRNLPAPKRHPLQNLENLESRSARRGRTHLRRIHAEAQMREPRLAERHESRIEVSPNEQQEEGHGSVIVIEDGIDHC